MPNIAYIGIGSNLGDRNANYYRALEEVSALADTRIVKQSSLYESEPHGDARTWFVNGVIEIECECSPDLLLKRLKEIEKKMGRKRVAGKKWGARIMDLDILLYNNEVVAKRSLKVPHPRLTERRFVLSPLSELAPQLVHPQLGLTVSQMLAGTPDAKKIRMFRAD